MKKNVSDEKDHLEERRLFSSSLSEARLPRRE